MPVAVIINSEPERFELKSLKGGYVTVREMSYGEKLVRQGMSGKLKVMAGKSEYAGELDMATRQLALWDFSNLVTDHNLEDLDGRQLNFKNPADVEKLSARIGDEVGTYIDKLNSFEDITEGN